MKWIIVMTVGAMLIPQIIMAQNSHFTTHGTIKFEKTINMHALVKKEMQKGMTDPLYQQAYMNYLATKPQFVKLTSSLNFNEITGLYAPENNNYKQGPIANPFGPQINTIGINYSNKTSICQKNVFDEIYLITDSLKSISWKITDEYREIAGYPCRRANAIIMDSIYVVAFYTEEIAVSGGPESFNGLPGMILGVALPHEHVTWFATKVMEIPIPPTSVAAPTKGKPITLIQLEAVIDKMFKGWGGYGGEHKKALML